MTGYQFNLIRSIPDAGCNSYRDHILLLLRDCTIHTQSTHDRHWLSTATSKCACLQRQLICDDGEDDMDDNEIMTMTRLILVDEDDHEHGMKPVLAQWLSIKRKVHKLFTVSIVFYALHWLTLLWGATPPTLARTMNDGTTGTVKTMTETHCRADDGIHKHFTTSHVLLGFYI